ncbi:tol-pal system protein YbgF [Oricola thermophila]|uniref:Cell division coordinator CpoB n=1 Tax=Oricola thermophila TaxID=2742145 RepID=A0A6N1VKX5_9HYPH|nr:tol-pal system protein YbgF [Oricola thermophila]QKV20455.1 tol-pal system protein YbgF [Oricola thermophila]
MPRLIGTMLTLAVFAGSAQAGDPRALPEGSYQVAQVTDPRVYALEEQMRQLNGRIEELTFQMLELQEQLRRMQQDYEFRFQQLEGGTATEPIAPTDGLPMDSGSLEQPPAQSNVADASPVPGTQIGNQGPVRGTPPRTLGTLKIDDSGAIVGGTVDFSENQISSAIDGQAVASLPQNADPEQLYREGYQHVLNGDYQMAEGIFRSFVESFPNDALTADARFWLAESVRGQGRLEEAVEIFIAIRQDYPDSQKAPETLLKIGQIMYDLGDRDVACVTFADAENTYPQMSESVRSRIREERAKAQC